MVRYNNLSILSDYENLYGVITRITRNYLLHYSLWDQVGACSSEVTVEMTCQYCHKQKENESFFIK